MIIRRIINKLLKKRTFKFGSFGNNVIVSFDLDASEQEKIYIGDNVYIGPGCRFIGHGGINIGSGTIIAHQVEILTRNHNYDCPNLKAIPYDDIYINKKVIIEENVWIGSHVLILPGIIIGEGSIVGMGSVVTKDVPSMAVVGGNPAKILKYRDFDRYIELKNSGKIYLKLKSEKYFDKK